MTAAPPVDLSAPSGGSWFFTILCLAIFAGATGWALARAARGDYLGVVMLAGGLVANLIEAMLDNLGLLWFATDNKLIVLHEFSRSMPLYVVLGYGFYFGAMSYYVTYALGRGAGPRHLWAVFVFGWFFDLVLETTGSAIGLYKYYGPEPFNPWGVPLWWMFVNPALPIAAGGLFHVMRPRLTGPRSLFIVALLPMCYGATYGAIAWPIFITLHSDVADWVRWVAGAVTAVFALVFVGLIVEALGWYSRRDAPQPLAVPDVSERPLVAV